MSGDHSEPAGVSDVTLPSWAQVTDKRRAHIARVTALLDEWAGPLAPVRRGAPGMARRRCAARRAARRAGGRAARVWRATPSARGTSCTDRRRPRVCSSEGERRAGRARGDSLAYVRQRALGPHGQGALHGRLPRAGPPVLAGRSRVPRGARHRTTSTACSVRSCARASSGRCGKGRCCSRNGRSLEQRPMKTRARWRSRCSCIAVLGLAAAVRDAARASAPVRPTAARAAGDA